MRKMTHEIIVDKAQGRGGPPSLPFLKLLLRMFSKNTSLKKSYIKVYVEQAFDHSLFVELMLVPKI
jgi:hypothetical protein